MPDKNQKRERLLHPIKISAHRNMTPSTKPNGSLSVSHSIRAKAPRWLTKGGQEYVVDTEQKKALYFDMPDWLSYSKFYQETILDTLIKTIRDEFEIYTLTKNGLTLLSVDKEKTLALQKNILQTQIIIALSYRPYKTVDQIRKLYLEACRKRHLSPCQISTFNYANMQLLLDDNARSGHTLDLTDFKEPVSSKQIAEDPSITHISFFSRHLPWIRENKPWSNLMLNEILITENEIPELLQHIKQGSLNTLEYLYI